MTTWKELRKKPDISEQDKNIIELEKDLIRAIVAIREEKGLTQAQLAEMCDAKQSAVARMESAVHSPQVCSLLKVLVPLGYTLQVVPIGQEQA